MRLVNYFVNFAVVYYELTDGEKRNTVLQAPFQRISEEDSKNASGRDRKGREIDERIFWKQIVELWKKQKKMPWWIVAIAQTLKEERIRAGLTQEQLAVKIGTKKTYISRLENGKADIQLTTLFRIFEGLGRRVRLTIL